MKKRGELPFFFKIDIDFDYLKVIVPTTSKPITNIGGSIIFSNFDDTTLVFENTYAQFGLILLKLQGILTLSERSDLNLVNVSPISSSDLIQNKMLKESQIMSFLIRMLNIMFLGIVLSRKLNLSLRFMILRSMSINWIHYNSLLRNIVIV